MTRILPARGFTFTELLVVLGVVTLVVTVVLVNFARSVEGSKATVLQENVGLLREALDLYRADHGWYPCDPERDWNRSGDPETMQEQLLRYTDASGEPSEVRDAMHRFGPYLRKWPIDPFTRTGALRIDAGMKSIFNRMADRVSTGPGTGGWFYEPRSGNICANLGRTYPTELAHY
jgi:prepilin-type N-terminal cleavage/methylation domain-containing protein